MSKLTAFMTAAAVLVGGLVGCSSSPSEDNASQEQDFIYRRYPQFCWGVHQGCTITAPLLTAYQNPDLASSYPEATDLINAGCSIPQIENVPCADKSTPGNPVSIARQFMLCPDTQQVTDWVTLRSNPNNPTWYFGAARYTSAQACDACLLAPSPGNVYVFYDPPCFCRHGGGGHPKGSGISDPITNCTGGCMSPHY